MTDAHGRDVGAGPTGIGDADPLTVHLFPGPERTMINPYLSMLTTALQGRGVRVVGLDRRSGSDGSPGVVHVHWPEMPLHSGRLKWAVWGSSKLLGSVVAARRRGLPLVWTVHNLQAHDGQRPVLQRVLWTVWPRLVSGWLSLSANGVERARSAFPALARRPWRVVPHGDYRAVVHTPDRGEARSRLGLEQDARVIALVGRIRPYKGAEELVAAATATPDEELRLVIGGACEDDGLRARLQQAQGRDPRVHLLLRSLGQPEVDDVLAAADLVVLPFRSVFNSGSVLLCLTAGRPVLAPRTPVFEELAAEVGGSWLRLYDGDLTPDVLTGALSAVAGMTGAPDLDRHRWDNVAAEHIAFYRGLLAGPSLDLRADAEVNR